MLGNSGGDDLERSSGAVAEAAQALCKHYRDQAATLEREAQKLQDQIAEMLRVPPAERQTTPKDVLRLNVGGDLTFAAMRSTLTCFPDSRLAELFSGRWDSALPRDAGGRIFLDLDPAQFRVLLDWLGDVCHIGPSACLPDPLELVPSDLTWGFKALCSLFQLPHGKSAEKRCGLLRRSKHTMGSNIEGSLLTATYAEQLLQMISNAADSKKLTLLHRASRDGFSAQAFHAKCDGLRRTLIVARSAGGFLFGGYSGPTAWSSNNHYIASEGAFLFRLAGPGVQQPSKHAVFQNHREALYCHASYGPAFGGADLVIDSSHGLSTTVHMSLGNTYSLRGKHFSVDLLSLAEATAVTITEMEVFAVESIPSTDRLLEQVSGSFGQNPQVVKCLGHISELLSVAWAEEQSQKRRRLDIESQRRHFEQDVQFMKGFIDVGGTGHDIVQLNVGGKIMTTTRSTLTQYPGSLLASKFGPQWRLQEEELVDSGVFLDLSPSFFTVVLKWMRLRRLCGDDLDLQSPDIPSSSRQMFERLLDFLNMKDHFPRLTIDSCLLSGAYIQDLQSLWPAGTPSVGHARLSYRASRDGFSAEAFHSKCDGLPGILVVAKSAGGFIFGGYSGSAAWSSMEQHVTSEGAFLFRLAGPGVQEASRHPLASESSCALYCGPDNGPTFGARYPHDLCLGSSNGPFVNGHMILGISYRQQAENCGVTLESLAESRFFAITELEAFVLA